MNLIIGFTFKQISVEMYIYFWTAIIYSHVLMGISYCLSRFSTKHRNFIVAIIECYPVFYCFRCILKLDKQLFLSAWRVNLNVRGTSFSWILWTCCDCFIGFILFLVLVCIKYYFSILLPQCHASVNKRKS